MAICGHTGCPDVSVDVSLWGPYLQSCGSSLSRSPAAGGHQGSGGRPSLGQGAAAAKTAGAQGAAPAAHTVNNTGLASWAGLGPPGTARGP